MNLSSLKPRYSLTWVIVVSLAVKFAIFLIGVAIMGASSSRLSLPSCQSTSSPSVPVYVAPYPDIEAYTDYRDLYLRCLVTPFLQGAGPYNLPIVNNYPPLFLYTLAGFAAISSIIWTAAVPLVTLDALTAIPVFLISRDFLFKGNSKLAFGAAIFWIANPLNLFYNDLMWLNTGPTTFFLILALYFFLKENYYLSSLLLAVSTGFKQVSFVVFPLLAIIIWKAGGFSKKLGYFVGIYIGAVLLISTPFIFEDSQFYLWALSLPILGTPPGYSSNVTTTTFVYDLGQPTRLTAFIGLIEGGSWKNIAVLSFQYLNYIFAITYIALLVYLLLSKRSFSKIDTLVLTLASFSIFFAFFGRGVYKYYFTTITALAIPFFKSRRGILLIEGFSLILLFAPREISPWMAILLITFLPNFLGQPSEPAADTEALTVTK